MTLPDGERLGESDEPRSVPVSPVQAMAREVRCIMGVVWGVALVMVLTA